MRRQLVFLVPSEKKKYIEWENAIVKILIKLARMQESAVKKKNMQFTLRFWSLLTMCSPENSAEYINTIGLQKKFDSAKDHFFPLPFLNK